MHNELVEISRNSLGNLDKIFIEFILEQQAYDEQVIHSFEQVPLYKICLMSVSFNIIWSSMLQRQSPRTKLRTEYRLVLT